MTEAATETAGTETAEAGTEATETAAAEQQTAETTQTNEADDARVQRANREAAKYRTELRAAQDALAEQGKTLAALAAVFNPDSKEADPAAQLANITGEAENLRSEAAQLRAELLVHSIAADNGGNPNALLDSRAFSNTLAGLDPAADDYREQVAKAITDAVAANKSLGAGPVPSRGGVPGAGQGSDTDAGSVTQEQFDAMGYQQRSELFQTNPTLYRRLAGRDS